MNWVVLAITLPVCVSGFACVGDEEIFDEETGDALDGDGVDGSDETELPTSCTPVRYQAEDVEKTTGGPAGTDGWGLWANGSVWTEHEFATATGPIIVRARSDFGCDGWALMRVLVDGVPQGESIAVASLEYEDYLVPYQLEEPGLHEVRLQFINDCATETGEDRNLRIDSFVVGCEAVDSL